MAVPRQLSPSDERIHGLRQHFRNEGTQPEGDDEHAGFASLRLTRSNDSRQRGAKRDRTKHERDRDNRIRETRVEIYRYGLEVHSPSGYCTVGI